MAAYVFLEATIPDFDALAEYMVKAPESFASYGARYLVRAGEVDVKEGSIGQHPVKAIVEFPNIEKARAWYESDAYQAIKHLRTNFSDGNVLIMDGI